MPLVQFKGAGFKGSELPRVKRFLPRMLLASHENQVESLLAYINGLNGKSLALQAAAAIITKHTGVATDRTLERMSGNTLPSGEPPSEEFTQKLKTAHREVFKALGFTYPEIKEDKYYAESRRVYDGNGAVWAVCPTQEQAEQLAEKMNQD